MVALDLRRFRALGVCERQLARGRADQPSQKSQITLATGEPSKLAG